MFEEFTPELKRQMFGSHVVQGNLGTYSNEIPLYREDINWYFISILDEWNQNFI